MNMKRLVLYAMMLGVVAGLLGTAAAIEPPWHECITTPCTPWP